MFQIVVFAVANDWAPLVHSFRSLRETLVSLRGRGLVGDSTLLQAYEASADACLEARHFAEFFKVICPN